MERSGNALVVGGGRGIGRAVCALLAPRHVKIGIVYRSDREAALATAELVKAGGAEVELIPVDIRNAEAADKEITDFAAASGGLDVLIHTAGASTSWKPVRELTPAEWTGFMNVDLNGFFNVVGPALRIMHRQKRGNIVAVTSISARAAAAGSAQTAAAKAGVEAMIRVIAREEGRSGIRVNAVAAGLTDTDQGREASAHWGKDLTERIIAQSALPRMGTAEEVAQVVAFLASPASSYVTGRVIAADGGQFLSA